MGEVFLAWDELLERQVAIKRIRQGSPQTHDQRERFRREARSAARLSHSAIVQIHELIPDLAGDAIVMEYVEGATLADRIAAGPLPLRDALRLVREIAEGLAAAHAAGLIHRDLKPENVVITLHGQAKILDFGLVKPMNTEAEDQTLTRKGILVGTYRSMSPEQASGSDVDGRSDLFSLGVLLYEMLSGQPPFHSDNPLATLKRVITDRPPSLSVLRKDVPQDVSDFVDHLLAKSRDDRPPNARTVIRLLHDLEASLPVSTSSGSVSEMATADLTKWTRQSGMQTRALTSTGGMSIKRRRWHAVAVGVVVLLTILGVAVTGRLVDTTKGQAQKSDANPLAPVIQADDSNAFHQIQQRVDSGEAVILRPELDRLEGIIQRSPRFPDAQILAARLALKLFQSTRESSYLNRAFNLVNQAKSLTPESPQLLAVEFQVVLEKDPNQADAVLQQMKQRLGANDPRYLVQLSLLLDRQGHSKEALDTLSRAAEKAATWQDLITLAQLEFRSGLVDRARAHLRTVLAEYPQNFWAHEIEAEIELYYGDPAKAEKIFLELASSTSRRNPRTNLGAARAAEGHYVEAVEAYESALTLEPYHPAALLGLAEAKSELGLVEDARAYYQKALDREREDERSTGRQSVQDAIIKAQCLARLGNAQEAARVTGETLRRSSDDPLVQSRAAMVYSLVGDNTNALVAIKAALSKGIQKSWFRGSAFHQLAKDPQYQSLIR
jgi:serine/threonine-protein kinase